VWEKFSDRSGFLSLKRLVQPPCRISDLPRIDAVLLTHSHYDHLDLPTLRELGSDVPILIAEGHRAWLGKKGFNDVREISWGGSLEIGEVHINAVAAQHFTARTPFDRNRGHWCGWVIEGRGRRLWHAGDSGYCPAFAEIGERFGKIDFGMIPIGAYQPRSIMKAMHMNPEESVQAFIDARCINAVGMHWGTFRLTDEPLGEPPLLLKAALEKHGLRPECFTTWEVGESRQV
jgi:N-acyl-phosphatidylethanolamine-hydrolysing phospholipase D